MIKTYLKSLFIIILILTLSFNVNNLYANQNKYQYFICDVKDLDIKSLNEVKRNQQIINYCQIDDKIIFSCFENDIPRLAKKVRSLNKLSYDSNLFDVYIAIRRGSESILKNFEKEINILYEKGPYTIFQAPLNVINEISKNESNHFYIEKFEKNVILRAKPEQLELNISNDTKSNLIKDINIDSNKLLNNIKKLEEFKTRYSYTENYYEAALWAKNEFEKLGLKVKLHEYMDGSKKQVNVIAQKDFNNIDNFYIVCAHLDSTSNKPLVDAPGADDNASGAAGVLEVARILSQTPYALKFRFVLFAGEEVGLKGSYAYVKELKLNNEILKIKGVINFDMIGFDKNLPLSSLIETYEEHKEFISNFISIANNSNLKISVSYKPWGSDHIPFLKEKIPCFLFIEDEFDINPNYHKVTDKSEFININLSSEIVKNVVVTLLKLVSNNN